MLDIGWSELLVIGVVALIVVGPKDLPRMFHALGRFTGKARSMAREFQRAMDDAARESGVKETADDLRKLTSKSSLGIDKLESAARKFEAWDPAKSAKPATPATPATPASAAAAPGSETARLAERRAEEAAATKAAAGAAAAARTSGEAPGSATPPAAVAESGTTAVAPSATKDAQA